MSTRLQDQLAAEEPRTAPEPETAEERWERLSRKRRIRLAGLLGVVGVLLWEGLQLLSHARASLGWLVVAGFALIWVLGELFLDREDEDDA